IANKFDAPADARAAGVQDLFATVAPRYDLINDLQSFGLHRRWKRQLIQWADPKPGERALDLCCGTGDVSFALAAKGADTTGLDFGKPENALWRKLYFAYLRCFVPVFGKIFCGDAQTYSYIIESLIHYPAQKGIAAAMEEIGCYNVSVRNLLGGIMSINYAQK